MTVVIVGCGGMPTHIFIALQAAGCDANQEQPLHVFDSADLRRIHVRVNNAHQFPDREHEVDYWDATKKFSRAYMMFQDAAMKYGDPDTGSQVSAEDFVGLYPIYHFDVSKRKEALNNAPADIEVRWNLGSAFEFPVGTAAAYNVYCLVMSEHFLRLEAVSGRMDIVV